MLDSRSAADNDFSGRYKKKHKFLWKTWYTFDYDLTVP